MGLPTLHPPRPGLLGPMHLGPQGQSLSHAHRRLPTQRVPQRCSPTSTSVRPQRQTAVTVVNGENRSANRTKWATATAPVLDSPALGGQGAHTAAGMVAHELVGLHGCRCNVLSRQPG